jgi:diguanylate cyclase (GGDEF)-like protein
LLPGEGVAGVVFEDMKPVIINKGSKDPRFKSKQVRDLDVESLLCTPMIRKDRCIGVINISNRRNHTPFQDADKSLMEIVSHHAATVIENARLYKLATVDGLTQLYVVRYFKVRLLEEFLRATRYRKSISVLMSDIDHFKNFNDTYGHQMGDIVLASVAGVVRETVRLSDFAARYGGEEFIVILPETDGEGAYKLAERVREQVENLRVPTANGDLSVTISVGVVTYPDYEMETSEEMIACADAALYQAKQTGRNKTCVFTAEMAEDS